MFEMLGGESRLFFLDCVLTKSFDTVRMIRVEFDTELLCFAKSGQRFLVHEDYCHTIAKTFSKLMMRWGSKGRNNKKEEEIKNRRGERPQNLF